VGVRKIRRILPYVLSILLLGIFGEKEIRAGESEEPYISSIEPSAGAPRIIVTILGRNFNKIVIIRDVRFGWNPADILEWTDHKIVVRVPYGKGTVKVRAEGPTGHSNSVSFTFMEPVIDFISPSVGQPGSEVTINGRYFGFKHQSPSFYVKFGKSHATVKQNSWTDEQIIVEAPSDYGTGENRAKFTKWLLKLAWTGYTGDIPGLIRDIVEELATQGVRIPPGQGKIEVDVRVTTPVGESNAVVFTYQVEPIVEPIGWREYRIGALSYSIPSDWKLWKEGEALRRYYRDQQNRMQYQSLGGIQRMYYTEKDQTGFIISVIDEEKGIESGRVRIIHYDECGGKKVEEPAMMSQRTINITHMGCLVDSFKAKVAGYPVMVCILRADRSVSSTYWTFTLIKGGKRYIFHLTSTDPEYQRTIFQQLTSRIRLGAY